MNEWSVPTEVEGACFYLYTVDITPPDQGCGRWSFSKIRYLKRPPYMSFPPHELCCYRFWTQDAANDRCASRRGRLVFVLRLSPPERPITTLPRRPVLSKSSSCSA